MDRVFFTRFAREQEALTDKESALKFHCATAAAVILPIDQLRFRSMQTVLLNQPKLVSEGAVKFVAGSNRPDLREAVSEQLPEGEPQSDELISILFDQDGSIETYPQPDTFEKFNRLFREQIEDRNSFARTFGLLSDQASEELLAEIGPAGIRGRQLYALLDEKFLGDARSFMRDLAEYLYLYAGASSSESRFILPQQELIEWSHAAPQLNEPSLSQEALFFEVLIENILLLGDDLSDIEDIGLVRPDTFRLLDYEDVFSLRKGIDFERFLERYVSIISGCERLSQMHLDERAFQSAEEILALREALVQSIKSELSADLSQHRMLRGAEGFVAFFGSILGLSYGLRSLLNSIAISVHRERQFVRWQERRLEKLKRALHWAAPRFPGSGVISYLQNIQKQIGKRLRSGAL